MFAKAMSKDGTHVAYIAPTYQQARDIAWAELKKLCSTSSASINESRLEITLNTVDRGTSSIWLRGWESIETLRGQRFDYIVVDEVASMRDFWANWQEVIRPTLTDTKGKALFISTPKGFNHFYDLFTHEAKDDDYKSFHFTSYDNPHIPPEELDKARKELTEDRFAQEYLADFRKTEGLVYKEFTRPVHIYGKTNPKKFQTIRKLIGIDWGFTNPCAVLTIVEDHDKNYYVTEEWYRTQKTTDEIIEYAASLKGTSYYPDPAEPDRIEELRRRGINTREVNKDVTAGIDVVRQLFKNNKLFIHESCKNMIMELETYSYKEAKPGLNLPEEPIKENDHACFAASCQVLTDKGLVNIDKIKSGDFVLTPFGKSRVLWAGKTGNKPVFNFMGKIKATSDHPFITQRGMVRMDALRYTDSLCIVKSSSWMESNSVGILARVFTVYGLISSLLKRLKKKDNDYTSTFGKNTIIQYLRGSIFIIKMVIHLIIHWKIWSVSPLQNIKKNIGPIGGRHDSLPSSKISIMQEHLPQSGMDLKKVLSYIKKLGKSVGRIVTLDWLKKNANNVIGFIKQCFLHDQNSATQTVKLEPCGNEDVFGLDTEHGVYVVNGVVIGNCDALRYVLYMASLASSDNKARQYIPKVFTYRRKAPSASNSG